MSKEVEKKVEVMETKLEKMEKLLEKLVEEREVKKELEERERIIEELRQFLPGVDVPKKYTTKALRGIVQFLRDSGWTPPAPEPKAKPPGFMELLKRYAMPIVFVAGMTLIAAASLLRG